MLTSQAECWGSVSRSGFLAAASASCQYGSQEAVVRTEAVVTLLPTWETWTVFLVVSLTPLGGIGYI